MDAKESEVWLDFLRLSRGPSDAVTVEEIRKAAIQVGATAKQQLEWALKFASTDLAQLTKGDWLNKCMELAAFRSPIRYVFEELPSSEKVPQSSIVLPLKRQIEEVHNQFNELLNGIENMEKGKGKIICEKKGMASFELRRFKDGDYSFLYIVPNFVDRCVIELMKLVAEFGSSMRKCPKGRDGCGRWFLASRSDKEYCSATCVNRATIRRFRARKSGEKRKHAKR